MATLSWYVGKGNGKVEGGALGNRSMKGKMEEEEEDRGSRGGSGSGGGFLCQLEPISRPHPRG